METVRLMYRWRGWHPTAFLGIILGSLFLGALWMVRDHGPPWYDQAHYMNVTMCYADALRDGFGSFVSEILHTETRRSPLFQILMVPLFMAFGSNEDSGLLLNLILMPVLLVSVYGIAKALFNRTAGLLAMLITATTPILVGLSHEVLQDYAVTAFAALAVLLAIRTKRFERRSACIVLGFVLGLGFLTKFNFPLFVLGPILACFLWKAGDAPSEPSAPDSRQWPTRRAVANLGLTLLIATLLALAWYLPNRIESLPYVAAKARELGSLGGASSATSKLKALSSFGWNIVTSHLPLPFLLAGAVAAGTALASRVLKRQRGAHGRFEWGRNIILVSWVLVPFLTIALARDYDLRLMAGALPGFAILLAASLSWITWTAFRKILIACACLAAVWSTTALTISSAREALEKATGLVAPTTLSLLRSTGDPHHYDLTPGPSDYISPVVDYLESGAEGKHNRANPVLVGVVGDSWVFNPNTMAFFAHSRQVPLTFDNQKISKLAPNNFESWLLDYDFIVVLVGQQGEVSRNLRLALPNLEWNGPKAGKILRVFNQKVKEFPFGEGSILVFKRHITPDLDVERISRKRVAPTSCSPYL